MKLQLGLIDEAGNPTKSEQARIGMEERGESVLAWAAQWNPAYVGTQTHKGDALFPRLEE
ncbi:MAG: hypothetical protein KDB07_07490 [Planctomycetes bacterium]|nr:hypothetical protein [Planctomycetota bacterium]